MPTFSNESGTTVPLEAAKRSVPENGPSFKNFDTHYRTSFVLFRKNHGFHFLVWRSIHGEHHSDYGFVTELPHIDPYLVFGTRQSRQQFQRWLNAYSGRYPNGNIGEHAVPPPPDKAKVASEISLSVATRDANLLMLWSWITEQCKGRVWFAADTIQFQREADAAAFLMRWG